MSGTTQRNKVNLWDYHKGLLKQSWDCDTALQSPTCVLSDSGAVLAKWLYTEPLEVYDCESGVNRKTWSDKDLCVQALNFSPSEEEIVVLYRANLNEVRMIRIFDGQMRSFLLPDSCSKMRYLLSDLGFSADGQTLALAEGNGILHLWNTTSMELLPPSPAPTGEIMTLKICRDQNSFARVNRKGVVDVLDMCTGKRLVQK